MGGMKKCECPQETEQSLRQRERERDSGMERHTHIHTDTEVWEVGGKSRALYQCSRPRLTLDSMKLEARE